MSDDDFMYESGEDNDYDFDYESDGEEEGGDVDLENQYYTAKGHKEADPDKAFKAFQQVIDQEEEKGDWGMKAHKQQLKLLFRTKKYDQMLSKYKSLLEYTKSAVSRNYGEKSINSVLEYISTAEDLGLMLQFYETTLESLKEAKNDRLWFKTNLKLGNLHLARNDLQSLAAIISDLRQSCSTDDGEDVEKKGTQLLEIYALEIQMYTEQKQNKKLKPLYEQSLRIKSAIPHPRILGIIRECGGKMHLREEQWSAAYEDFFEAFKNYDESGSPKKIACLKYLVLANMLMKSDVDPFDAQESKPYRNNSDVSAMTSLVAAYQSSDIKAFEKILRTNKQSIMGDPFVREYIQDLLTNVRVKVVQQLLRPYTRARISFISDRLSISEKDVEDLLVSCIHNNSISGRIDQLEKVIYLDTEKTSEKFEALQSWTNKLNGMLKSFQI